MALKRKVDLASGVLLALLGVVKCLFKGRVHCTPSFSRILDWRWNGWRLVASGLSLVHSKAEQSDGVCSRGHNKVVKLG